MAASTKKPAAPVLDDDLDDLEEVAVPDKKGAKVKKKAADLPASVEMPPDSRKDNKKDKKQKEKKGKGGLIAALILLLMIGGLVAVVVLNLFGIRDKYLSGILSKIPIVNNILPPEDTGEEPEFTNEELLLQIAELQKDVENKDKRIKDLEDSVDNYIKELEPLRNMEEQQVQYRLDKDAFDAAVALGDTKQFQQWYEGINPDLAQEFYKEAVTVNTRDKEVKDYINKVSGMEPASIAKAMETFIGTDMELIVLILKAMDDEIASEVMGAMTPTNAGAVVRQMRPDGL